jgi:cytoskeletal protein CcmA (bactofilin family)
VTDQASLVGGFDSALGEGVSTACVLSGQVSKDGQVTASGPGTTTAGGVVVSNTLTLSGRISGGIFTGELVGDGSVPATATLQ